MAKINMKKIQDGLINRGVAGLAGGATAQFLNKKVIPASVNPMVKNIGTALVGAIVPEFVPKLKFAEGFGAGMAGVAGANLLDSMMDGTATKSEVNGLEDEAWTPIKGLPMDDDADMNGTDDDFEVDNDSDDVNGTGNDVIEE